MLKADWTQNIILIIFAIIMMEVLTPVTLIFIALGLALVFFQKRPSKLVRNILALMIFGSYWITYGKIIDPEIGLNFLTSIIVLKILEKETVRDRYMIFFGLMLLISAGSLFERTITYVLFFTMSFLFLVRDFYSYLGQKWKVRDLLLAVLWVIPLTFSLFFLVPRMMNPIPFNQGNSSPGEIGYTPDVNLSTLESLTSNTNPVFQALVNRPLNQGELYWRGNTLSYTDGWNWTLMPRDRSEPEALLGSQAQSYEVEQTIRLFNRSDFFFALEYPRTISYGKNFMGLTKMKTLSQGRWQWTQRYVAVSAPGVSQPNTELVDTYLKLPLPKKTRTWIHEHFQGTTVSEIERELKKYFVQNQFSYSLSPGRSSSFEEFMEVKKIGLCSHYASVLAIILRVKGIPSRLVSGFMGGTYNRYADFYLISQNDAHVWVEALDGETWKRLDPTEWIAPDRVLLGGEAFMESVRDGKFQKNRLMGTPPFLRDLRQWFAQWDFVFYVWLEQMDYQTQDAWLTRLKFKREWLFTVIPLIMVVFMGLYSLYIFRRKKKDRESHHQELWQLFYAKMDKKGLKLSAVSLKESEEMLKEFQHQDKDKILVVWKDLVGASFRGDETSGLKNQIKEL